MTCISLKVHSVDQKAISPLLLPISTPGQPFPTLNLPITLLPEFIINSATGKSLSTPSEISMGEVTIKWNNRKSC
jgi:hypothetical protein